METPLGSAPDGWDVVPLGALTRKIGSGATPLGGEVNYLPARLRYALIRSQSVFDRFFDCSTLSFISDEQAAQLKSAIVEPDDVLLNITGDGITFGRAALVPDAVLPACVNQHVAIIRPNQAELVPGFLLAYLTHPKVKPYIESFNAGGSRRAITKGNIENFLIPLPPLADQRAIAAVLGALDDKIEACRRMNATLEATARALFKSWFVDFDPVRAKMEGREPAVAPDLAALFPARLTESPLGPIPEGWEARRYDSLASNVSDIAKADELGGDEHYIGLEHMPRKSISLDAWDDASGLESHKARFRVGDTLFGKLRPYFHKVGRALIDGVCSTDIVVVRAHRTIHAAFLLMVASSNEFVAFNDQSSTGTKMPRTSWGRMAEYELIAPTDAVCEAFEAVASPMLDRLGASVFQSRTLAQLRGLLLPKLLSGVLRVRDAEAMVEDAA